MGNIPRIDQKEFEQIANALLILNVKSEDETIKSLIAQVSKMNDLLRRMHTIMSLGGPAPPFFSTPNAANVSNPDEFWHIIGSYRSHLASHDKHLAAHDGHLKILGDRIDDLEKQVNQNEGK